MRGHEVDRRVRVGAVFWVAVAGAGDARGELGQRLRLAAPVVADRVAVLAVPLRPQRREVADLVAALPDVPRLGGQLYPAPHPVLLGEIEESREAGHPLGQARGGRGGIETGDGPPQPPD